MSTTHETTTAPVGETADTITDKLLPEIGGELTTLSEMAEEERKKVEALIDEIDMSDSNSIIFFGTKAQQQLTTLSDNMLEGVKNKDIGPVADSLNDMVATLRGFGADDLMETPGFFARLFGRAKPVVKFLQRYEEVRKQIDAITDSLEEHKTKMLTDITSLDRLYEANLDYFQDLEAYIVAGDEKLNTLAAQTIPSLEGEVSESDDVLEAQRLRDIRTARDDLERRVHDLRLTRQVTMQGLPGIRLVQENDKGLVRKIQSTMANTMPLWRQQLAQAVTVYRSGQAAETVKAATDLTNELLESNAENLQVANREVRKQIERGVFDVEVVKRANQTLIDTIEESLQIADEGKRRRDAAVQQLTECEQQLRHALSQAHSHVAPTGADTSSEAKA